MGEREQLVAIQELLGRALCARDPEAVLSDGLREDLRGVVDADGLRIAALLVARLRFERLLQGSEFAHEWFERDPREFSAAFKRYHEEVPPGATDPWSEASDFLSWRS